MAKCQTCGAITLGGIKQGNHTFCSKKCQNAYTPPVMAVTCGKCGTENALHQKKCVECDDYLHQYKPPEELGQAKCPNCSERISPDATLCPACKQPIYSKNKQTNALIGLVMATLSFFVLYYLFNTFINYETDRQMQNYQQEATQEYNRMMQEAQKSMNNP